MPNWVKAFPRHGALKCSAAWHLRKSGLYLATYDLVGAVTAGGKNPFFTSIKHVALYFGSDYETQRRVFKGLRKLGWLDYDAATDEYRYVKHEVWAARHKDSCNVREELPWESETDPLFGRIYGAAGGRIRIMEKQWSKLREHAKAVGLDDDGILALFETELAAAAEKKSRQQYEGTSPISCLARVSRLLKARAENLVVSR